MTGGLDYRRYVDVWVARVGVCERLLGSRFEVVVEFFGDPGAQFVDDGFLAEPGHERPEEPRCAAELGEVTEQGATGTRILNLDGDLAAVMPDGPVHLADRRGSGRGVVKFEEILAPGLAEVGRQHLMHGTSGQRRRGLLQLGQRGPVGSGDFRRQRGLEDGQGLAELHRPALELTEHPEDLLGGALLDLGGDDLAGPAAKPFSQPQGGPADQPGRKAGQLRSPRYSTAR